jgi:hypothetical protein
MSPEENLNERKARLDSALDAVILAPHYALDESSSQDAVNTVRGMLMDVMDAQKRYAQALLHAAETAPSHELSEDYQREAHDLSANVLFFVKTVAEHKSRHHLQ